MKEYHNYKSKLDLADYQFAKNYVNHQGPKLLCGVFVSQSITIEGIKNVLIKQAALILKIPRISLPYLKKPCGGFYSHFLCIFIRLFRSKMTKNPVSRQKNAKILQDIDFFNRMSVKSTIKNYFFFSKSFVCLGGQNLILNVTLMKAIFCSLTSHEEAKDMENEK